MISFVIFDAESLMGASSYIASMFGAQGLPVVTPESLYYFKSYLVVFVIAIIGATPLPKRLAAAAEKNKYISLALPIGEPLVMTALLVTCTAFLIDGSFNPFLYFRF